MAGVSDLHDAVPVADGVFTWPSESPQLIGTRFRSSGVTVFPQATSCPRTAAQDGEPVLLPTHGTLWSWTIQGFLPKNPPYAGKETPHDFVPYGVGYVELRDPDTDVAVIVESRLTENDPKRLTIGMPMDMVIVPFTTDDDGTPVVTYAFAPRADETGASA
jgi:uncharacterized protein